MTSDALDTCFSTFSIAQIVQQKLLLSKCVLQQCVLPQSHRHIFILNCTKRCYFVCILALDKHNVFFINYDKSQCRNNFAFSSKNFERQTFLLYL